MCLAVVRSPNQVDVEFLPKCLHDMGAVPMRDALQAAVDQVDGSRYSAVLMGYALCGMGLAGLTARSVPLVVPRGHDCITLFLGSKEKYLEYFQSHPGVYFKTTGWIERGEDIDQLGGRTIHDKLGGRLSYEDLVAKYGEDNAEFLYGQLRDYTRNYGQLTFIEMGVEPDSSFERRTLEEARRRGWKFEKVRGDMSLIQRMVDGQWDDRDFLLVPPGWRVVAKYDEGIIGAEKS